MPVPELNTQTFDEALATHEYVLIDYWAAWCGPCRTVGPIIEQIAEANQDRLFVAKVNIDQNPALVARFGIMAIPTLIIFHHGEIVELVRGALPRSEIERKIDQHVPRSASR